jgi:hypothetical protein
MTNATGTNVWVYTDTGSACAGCGAGITNSVTDPLNRVIETVNTAYGLPHQVIRFELDTPTKARGMPTKIKRRNSFSATNASRLKQSSPTLTEHPNTMPASECCPG